MQSWKKELRKRLLRFLWNFINIVITKYFIRVCNYFLFNFNYFWNFIIVCVCVYVCVCIIYKNSINESVTQETFHKAKVLSFELSGLQRDDYKIKKKARKLFLFVNLVKPSWFALRVTPTHFIMILRSRVSSFLSTMKKKGEREGEIPHLAANRHKTASLQNESLVFTTHLRERYKRFIFEVIKRGLKVSL